MARALRRDPGTAAVHLIAVSGMVRSASLPGSCSAEEQWRPALSMRVGAAQEIGRRASNCATVYISSDESGRLRHGSRTRLDETTLEWRERGTDAREEGTAVPGQPRAA